VTLLESALRRVADDLRARRTPFALVGGLAVWARCEPRFTRDVDLAVAVSSDPEAEALVRGLMDAGYRVLAQVEQESFRWTRVIHQCYTSHRGSPDADREETDQHHR
jgi:hypothetical protein